MTCLKKTKCRKSPIFLPKNGIKEPHIMPHMLTLPEFSLVRKRGKKLYEGHLIKDLHNIQAEGLLLSYALISYMSQFGVFKRISLCKTSFVILTMNLRVFLPADFRGR